MNFHSSEVMGRKEKGAKKRENLNGKLVHLRSKVRYNDTQSRRWVEEANGEEHV